MPTIFISYRRADSERTTRRIYDRLVERYGRAYLFKDRDSIPSGRSFPEVAAESIQASDVALVIIGPRWLEASAGRGRRRLDDPADTVRVEIETALRLGIAVLLVLVDGATLPPGRRLPHTLRPLLRQQEVILRRDPDFTDDMARLCEAIDYWQAQPHGDAAPTFAPSLASVSTSVSTSAPAPAAAPSLPPAPMPAVMPAAAPMPTAMLTAAASAPVAAEVASAARRPAARKPASASAIADQLGIAASRRQGMPRHLPRLAPVLTPLSALVVIAVGVGLLKSGVAASLFTHPNVQATQTVSAQSTSQAGIVHMVNATSTAQSLLLTQPYIPVGVGPCDTHDPPYRYSNPNYWSWQPGSAVTCLDGKTAQIANTGAFDGDITFWGFPSGASGFPTAFTLSATATFTASGSYTCAYLTTYFPSDSAPDAPQGVRVCRDGSWQVSYNGGAEGSMQYMPATATLHLVITMTASDIAFSVNGRQIVPPTAYIPPLQDISIGLTGASSDTMTISDFKLIPTAP